MAFQKIKKSNLAIKRKNVTGKSFDTVDKLLKASYPKDIVQER